MSIEHINRFRGRENEYNPPTGFIVQGDTVYLKLANGIEPDPILDREQALHLIDWNLKQGQIDEEIADALREEVDTLPFKSRFEKEKPMGPFWDQGQEAA